MSDTIYKILLALKNKGEDISEQVDIFYALKKITKEQYEELTK